jgi:cell division protease FtsH
LSKNIGELHIVAKGLIEYETLTLAEMKDLIKGISPSRDDLDNDPNDPGSESTITPSVPKTPTSDPSPQIQ